MPMEVRLKPVETLLFRGEIAAVGKFRCRADDAIFGDSGPCTHHTFVFPRTVTAIRHEGGREFVGAPGSVLFYNENQRYRRRRISDIDASDWYTVATPVLLDVLASADPRASLDPARPFRTAVRIADPRSFVEQRLLFDRLDRGEDLEPLEVEETVLRLLRLSLAARRPERRLSSREIDAVESVREVLALAPERRMTLEEMARAASISPFRLCRAFRARTGETITAFRHALRLNRALDLVRDTRTDLTTIALDLGYSSHSHFTERFRRHFGVTPSSLRAPA